MDTAELDGVEGDVDDVSVHHEPGDILEPEPAELREENDPEQREVDVQRRSEH